jgi:hypothetical protein
MASRREKIAERLRQIRTAFRNTRQHDPRLVPLMLGIGFGAFAVVLGIGLLFGSVIFGPIFAVLIGSMAALITFNRRLQKAAMSRLEGQPGAAAAVLQSMRGPWKVTPAVAITRKQAFVHRVVGRPGVVLVGEGAPARVTSLLRQEKRRVARAVGDIPVHEVNVGEGEGQVPLRKLQSHMTKMPRAMKPRQVGPLDRKLSALGDQQMPIPKGPIPRAPKGGRAR